MVIMRVYSIHLPCLFPHQGPGMKHQRRIALEPWQQAIVSQAPWAFLRGLIRSDGCAFLNRFDDHALLTYDFANTSQDILELFARTCDRVGVEYRRYERRIRINRRSSVALLAAEVGIKT